MKKIFCVGLMVAMSCGALFSQNKKGNLFLGTSLGSTGYGFGHSENGSDDYSEVSKSDNTSFSISVGPTIGYYLTDNLVVGTYLGLGFYTSKYDNSYTVSTDTAESKYSSVYFSLGPFGRYYFGDASGKGRLYAQVNAGINLYPVYKSTYTPSSGSGYEYTYTKYSSWNAAVYIGYEHYINSAIGIQFYVAYSFNHNKQASKYDYTTGLDYTYNYISNSHSISFGVGFQVHLETKKKNN